MLIILLAYFGGILTILSPCILPVLPFVFARADRSFVRSALPMLAGMAATFAIVATLAAVGGGWAIRANEVGRWAALLLLALFGIALVFPGISDRLTRPLVAWVRACRSEPGEKDSVWSSAVLGVATGLLVGAVCRTDPGHHLHRRRSQRGELQHDFALACLRPRCSDLARPRAGHWRHGFRAHEEVARGKRAHSSGPWRAGAGWRRSHCPRARHSGVIEAVERADREFGNGPRPQARREPANG